jgi:5'-nucleotidase
MSSALNDQLVVAISSRALFNFEEENKVFEQAQNQAEDQVQDQAYMQLQLQRLEEPATPGVAFSLVKKLLRFNTDQHTHVEVVILSRNDPVSGMRVFRSIEHYGLSIVRGGFTRGQAPWPYLRPLNAHLFLSANEDDVRAALNAGVPAARVYPQAAPDGDPHPDQVRIAFDGDAVLFSDEAERIYQAQGLDAFTEHEKAKATQPLPSGPFRPLLQALHRLQNQAYSPIHLRTALFTARSAPAHERAIRTLMDWHIQVDEAFFLGGLPKGPFLKAFEPDFFFDDQTGHIEHARAHQVPSGHVASGVMNHSQKHKPGQTV